MNNTPQTEIIIKRNTIIQGDCVSVMSQIPSASINFILTDPPYLIRYRSRDGRKILNDDNSNWLKPAYAEMYRILGHNNFCVSFYSWRYADHFIAAYIAAGFRIIGHLTFPKRYTSSIRYLRSQHECAYLLAKGNPKEPTNAIGDVIDWTYSGNKLHPTQKPVSALLPLIDTFCAPQGLVLDPFSGSGSTLLAAKMLGRSYLGIELDPNYHTIAIERLQAIT